MWSFIVAGVLIVNAMAILHPDRFLAKYGLHDVDHEHPTKRYIAQVLSAARSQQDVLIGINFFVILYEFGVGMIGSLIVAGTIQAAVMFIANVQSIVESVKKYVMWFAKRLFDTVE